MGPRRAPQRRPFRQRRQPSGPLRRPTTQDLHHRPGRDGTGARLVSLPTLPHGLQSAGPGAGPAASAMTGLPAERVLLAGVAKLLGRRRRAPSHRTRTHPDPDPLPRSRRHRRAHAQGRDPRSDGSAKTRRPRSSPSGRPTPPPSTARPCATPTPHVASRDTDTVPSPFALRAVREAQRRSFDRVPRVVLGDGAPTEHLPAAIQIVDVFHAKQHLFDVAKAIYGAANLVTWGKQRRTSIKAASNLLAALNVHSQKRPEMLRLLKAAPHQVEAVKCLKRGGMHWTAPTILALRCAILSNRFNDFGNAANLSCTPREASGRPNHP